MSLRRLAAEFTVIVLGVLVALAADRWRESQVSDELRVVYLENLLLDLANDLESFRTRPLDRTAERVLALGRGVDPPVDSLGHYLLAIEALHWYDPPLLARDTYDDLHSTGGVALFAPALRRVLSQYYSRADRFETREVLFRERLVSGYLEVPSEVLGPRLHPEIFDRIQSDRENSGSAIPDPGAWSVDPQEFAEVAARLRSVEGLETMVAERLYVGRQHMENYGERMSRMALELVEIINGVLDGTLDPATVAFSDRAQGL